MKKALAILATMLSWVIVIFAAAKLDEYFFPFIDPCIETRKNAAEQGLNVNCIGPVGKVYGFGLIYIVFYLVWIAGSTFVLYRYLNKNK